MPKKTKREKIIAELRRRNQSPSRPFEPRDAVQAPSSAFAFRASSKDTVGAQSNTEELTVIRHDLIRTIIFALVAVGIELGIYWKISGK
jgi:hypothetical protein